jgi:hypothetical protein
MRRDPIKSPIRIPPKPFPTIDLQQPTFIRYLRKLLPSSSYSEQWTSRFTGHIFLLPVAFVIDLTFPCSSLLRCPYLQIAFPRHRPRPRCVHICIPAKTWVLTVRFQLTFSFITTARHPVLYCFSHYLQIPQTSLISLLAPCKSCTAAYCRCSSRAG